MPPYCLQIKIKKFSYLLQVSSRSSPCLCPQPHFASFINHIWPVVTEIQVQFSKCDVFSMHWWHRISSIGHLRPHGLDQGHSAPSPLQPQAELCVASPCSHGDLGLSPSQLLYTVYYFRFIQWSLYWAHQWPEGETASLSLVFNKVPDTYKHTAESQYAEWILNYERQWMVF